MSPKYCRLRTKHYLKLRNSITRTIKIPENWDQQQFQSSLSRVYFKLKFDFCTSYFLPRILQLLVQEGTEVFYYQKVPFLHNREDRLRNEKASIPNKQK